LEKISKHLFESTIWSIGYFGTKEMPKLWIELRSPTKIQWMSYDINARRADKICSFEPTNKIKTWLKGMEEMGLFLCLKSGINPGIEAINAYNLISGDLIYEVNITQWLKFTNSHIQIIQDKTVSWMNLKTGILEIPTEHKEINENSFGFENPSHFEENQEGFAEFKTFFHQKFNENIVKGLDCWDGNDKLIFSYYLYEDGLKNILRVCNKGFETEHIEVIAIGDNIGFHTFQIFERQLIYIKDKHQLIVYEF
jgi:hypothetical protein